MRQSGDISASRYDEARAALATAEARGRAPRATLVVRQQELQIAGGVSSGRTPRGRRGAERRCLLLRAPIDGGAGASRRRASGRRRTPL